MSVGKTRPPTFEEWAKEAKRLPKDTILKLWWEKIEKCWKYQLSTECNGNAAKMREVMVDIQTGLAGKMERSPALMTPHEVAILKRCEAALAEPPRQCDVGTAVEQAQRFGNHCESLLTKDGSKPCTGCPCCGVVQYGRCEFAWMQMPYNKSEAVQ